MARESAESSARESTATPRLSPSTFTVIADDALATLPTGHERRNAFMDALGLALERMVDEEMRGTALEGRGCPIIEHYVDYYRAQPLHNVRRAAARFSGLTQPPRDAHALRRAIVARTRQHLRAWRRTGELPRLPGLSLPALDESVLDAVFGDERGEGVQRKADGPAAATPHSPLGALATLGPGAPLPARTRGQLEPHVPQGLGGVRVHTDARAAALTSHENAHALTVGEHIAFAPGAFQPGTLQGDALLAHEIAHTVQQRRPRSAGRGALEHDADRFAMNAMLGRRASIAGGAGGAAMQYWRCGSEPTFDWRGEAEETTTDATARIRELQAELERLSAGDMTPETQARITELQDQITDELDRLRGAGIQTDVVSLMRSIGQGEDILQLTGRIEGTEPTNLDFGERRQLRLSLDWVPQGTDVRVGWLAWIETTATTSPPVSAPTGDMDKVLNETFWRSYELQARQNRLAGGPALPRVRIMAHVFVSNDRNPAAQITSEWLSVGSDVPDTTTIASPRIFTMNPEASLTSEWTRRGTETLDGRPRGGSERRPSRDYVLEDTTVPFFLSWVPPIGWSTGRGYRIIWATSDANATLTRQQLEERGRAGGRGRQASEQNTSFEHRFGSPGQYVVYAVVQPGRVDVEQRTGQTSTTMPTITEVAMLTPEGDPLVGARRINVVSTDSLAERYLGEHGAERDSRSYASFLGDIDSAIASTEETMAGGSLRASTLESHLDQLREQRTAVTNAFGEGAMLPFPENESDLNQERTYVAPIATAYAHPEIGGAQPLATYVRLRWNGSAWVCTLIDATTAEVLPRTGSNQNPREAIVAAIADWNSRNDFPTGGHVAYRFDRYGWNIRNSFTTTSTEKTVREWAQGILSTVGIIVGVLLLLLPEPTTSAAGAGMLYGVLQGVGVSLMVAGILAGSYEIGRNIWMDRPVLSERNALEAVGIVASVVGLRGTVALGSAGRSIRSGTSTVQTLTQIRMGERLVLASSVLDAGTFVYVSGAAMSQLYQVARDDSIPESDRERMLFRTMAMLAMQGILLVGSNRDLFGRVVSGRRRPGLIDQRVRAGDSVELDPFNRAMLQIELRNLGLQPDEVAGLNDAALIRLLGTVHEALATSGRGAALGSAYGQGIYPLQADALSLSQFKSALRGGMQFAGNTSYSFSNSTNTATLTIDVGGTPHTVEVVFLRYPRPGVTVPPSPHDRPGRARFAMQETAPGQYTATVYLHERLSRDDTRLLANSELREIATIVERYPTSGAADFTTHREAQQRVGIFHRTTTTTAGTAATAEDVSSAHAFRRLWEASGFEQLPGSHAVTPGPAQQRLDVALREMGFGRTATHSQLVAALQHVLGTEATPKMIEYVRQFRWRRSAVARLGYYSQHGFQQLAGDPTVPTGPDTLISQGLIEHLMIPHPAGSDGVRGGHLDAALHDFAASHPDYTFTQVDQGTTHEGIDFVRYHQEYNGTLVANGPHPIPKTTVNDLQGFMTALERTVLTNEALWSTWPAGHRSFGTGMNHPALVSPAGTEFGGALVVTHGSGGTTVEVVAGWID